MPSSSSGSKMSRALLLTLLVTACEPSTEPCRLMKHPAVYINQYNNGVLIKADTLFVAKNTCTGEITRWEGE